MKRIRVPCITDGLVSSSSWRANTLPLAATGSIDFGAVNFFGENFWLVVVAGLTIVVGATDYYLDLAGNALLAFDILSLLEGT